MKSKDVMLDLETMGVESNSAIVSIGAVAFNEEEITEEFYAIVDLQSCLDVSLTISASTLYWWLEQGIEVRKELISDRVILPLALSMFRTWLENNFEESPRVWGNSCSFDNVILTNAYKACGLIVPWKFWNDRCYRTVKNMYPDIKLVRKGDLHNSLEDARSQARHLIAMGVKLR